jgi:vanillate O-demethylase ferredoxin subunit
MLAAFESATANWPREQIHVEYFTSKAEPAKTEDFTVELARSKQEFFIAKGKTILEVLLDAGVNVAYSCEAGICGACQQRVIYGIAEHRDSILTEHEQAANERVMMCCTGCKSDQLGLDL